MKNLKKETIECLKDHGKTYDDVKWVGTLRREISVDVFWALADRMYDDGYGAPEVNECLLVVGDNWWLERHEYDGAEWWEYKELPLKPSIMETENQLHFIFQEV